VECAREDQFAEIPVFSDEHPSALHRLLNDLFIIRRTGAGFGDPDYIVTRCAKRFNYRTGATLVCDQFQYQRFVGSAESDRSTISS
jgi:hypothetical protein